MIALEDFMTNWVDDLCHLFEKEIHIYKELLAIEKEKKEAIIKADARNLQELTKKSYDYMVSASELDRVRMSSIQEYYEKNNYLRENQRITLTDFLNKLDRDSNFKLKAYATELKSTVHKLKEAILINEKLIGTRQGILQATIQELQKQYQEPEPTYTPGKNNIQRKKEEKVHSVVLNASA